MSLSARRRPAHGHVAAVAVEDRLDAIHRRLDRGRQDGAALRALQAGAVGAVEHDGARRHDERRIGLEQGRQLAEIVGGHEEIVVEEQHEVDRRHDAQQRVALRRRAFLAAGVEKGQAERVEGGAVDVLLLRRAQGDAGGRVRLLRHVPQRFRQDGGAAGGGDRDADGKPDVHRMVSMLRGALGRAATLAVAVEGSLKGAAPARAVVVRGDSARARSR